MILLGEPAGEGEGPGVELPGGVAVVVPISVEASVVGGAIFPPRSGGESVVVGVVVPGISPLVMSAKEGSRREWGEPGATKFHGDESVETEAPEVSGGHDVEAVGGGGAGAGGTVVASASSVEGDAFRSRRGRGIPRRKTV